MNMTLTEGQEILPLLSFNPREEAVVSQATTYVNPLPPTIWDRGYDGAVGWFKGIRLSRAKSTLEQQLARIIETANGHQAKGLPTGSPAYGGPLNSHTTPSGTTPTS